MIRLAYLGLFSVTRASMPEKSKMVILFWQRKKPDFMRATAFRKRLIIILGNEVIENGDGEAIRSK